MKADTTPYVVKFGTIYEREGTLYIEGFYVDGNKNNMCSKEVVMRAIIERLEREIINLSDTKYNDSK